MQNLDHIQTQFENLIGTVRDAQRSVSKDINSVDAASLQRDATQLIGQVKSLSAKDAHEIKNYISTLIEDLDKLAEILRHNGKNA